MEGGSGRGGRRLGRLLGRRRNRDRFCGLLGERRQSRGIGGVRRWRVGCWMGWSSSLCLRGW